MKPIQLHLIVESTDFYYLCIGLLSCRLCETKISGVIITVVTVAPLNHLLNYEQNTKYNFPK